MKSEPSSWSPVRHCLCHECPFCLNREFQRFHRASLDVTNASRSYVLVWHFTSFLTLPLSYMLKSCSCMQFPTGKHLQTNQGGCPPLDYPTTCHVTLNYMLSKCHTSNMLVLVHTYSPEHALESHLSLLKALEMLFACCMTAVLSQWTSI